MSDKMICKVCGKEVKVRKETSFGCFPDYHLRTATAPCHGFFEEGQKIAEKE